METNEALLDENVDVHEPPAMDEMWKWLEEVFTTGADLEEQIEKAIFTEVFVLLHKAGPDEARRYKALGEMHKFAKWLEQKRSRQERTEVQKRRLDLLQTAQEIKLQAIQLRQVETASRVPARVKDVKIEDVKAEKAKAERPASQDRKPQPPQNNDTEPAAPGIPQEPAKRKQPRLVPRAKRKGGWRRGRLHGTRTRRRIALGERWRPAIAGPYRPPKK